jgi:hypothetical protein
MSSTTVNVAMDVKEHLERFDPTMSHEELINTFNVLMDKMKKMLNDDDVWEKMKLAETKEPVKAIV